MTDNATNNLSAQAQTLDPEQVLHDLNGEFHSSYSTYIAHTRAKLGKKETPVIVVSGDRITLFHDDQQETVDIIPSIYQNVKAINHVSFGVYVSLADNGVGPLRDDIHEDIIRKLSLMETAMTILDQIELPPDYVQSQSRALQLSIDVIEDVLSAGAVDGARLARFGRQSAPLYKENAAISAQLELNILHDTVMRWREQMDSEHWRKIYAIICAAHQARYRETTKQYFQRLLGERDDLRTNRENRVIYAEHIKSVEEALDLLARHINDQKASLVLFGHPLHLQQDLMADGAAEHIQKLIPI